MVKALAIIALALGLEVGFLLTAAIPPRPHVEAPTQVAKPQAPAAPANVAEARQHPVHAPGRS